MWTRFFPWPLPQIVEGARHPHELATARPTHLGLAPARRVAHRAVPVRAREQCLGPLDRFGDRHVYADLVVAGFLVGLVALGFVGCAFAALRVPRPYVSLLRMFANVPVVLHCQMLARNANAPSVIALSKSACDIARTLPATSARRSIAPPMSAPCHTPDLVTPLLTSVGTSTPSN